jgi:hypothetical protein
MKFGLLVLAVLSPLAFTGCATVTGGGVQDLAVETQTAKGQPVDKAKCTLANDKGTWTVESPGSVKVRKSAKDLMVECQKDGLENGSVRAVSRVRPAMFGNALIGGGIGAIIDHRKGTAYDYPTPLSVTMGTSGVIDKRDEQARRKDPAGTETPSAGATVAPPKK